VTPARLGSVHYYTGVLHGEAAAQHYGLWAPLSLGDPRDLVFVALAVPLLAAALRRRPALWELAVLAALAAMSIEARRNGVWLVLFAATPAARALGHARLPRVSPRLALACCAVPVAIAVHGLLQPHAASGAGAALLQRATDAAQGSPILADPVDAENVALHGGRIWIGNPLDAFPRADQRLYLEWLEGAPAGDAILAGPIRVVIVEKGSAPQKRLARLSSYRELARDRRAVLYAART
jgi:hypothetical protein